MLSALSSLRMTIHNDAKSECPVSQLFNPLCGFDAAMNDIDRALLLGQFTSSNKNDDDSTTITACISDDSLTDISTIEDDDNDVHKKEERNQEEEQPIKMTPPGKRRVRFSDASNRVHLIPSHRAYTEEERNTIWTSTEESDEIYYNCSLEYAYEGWTVDGVLEEDQLWIQSDGSVIHPAIALEWSRRQDMQRIVQAEECCNRVQKRNNNDSNTTTKSNNNISNKRKKRERSSSRVDRRRRSSKNARQNNNCQLPLDLFLRRNGSVQGASLTRFADT